jgi:FMN phosphatase YigB (HAD superfamily)
MKKRYFLFDFDDVLFNTRKFRDDIIRLFLKFGISKKYFYKTYKDFPVKKKNGDIVMYDPEKQFRKLKNNSNIDISGLQKEFYKLVSNSGKYIFKDVIEFLEKIKKDNLYIISYGKNNLQKLKIKNSGLEKYFDKISIINKNKSEAIPYLFGKKKIADEEVYFFEDREKFIKDVKSKYPFIKTILMKRKEGRYRDRRTKYCDFVIKNFKEAERIIN